MPSIHLKTPIPGPLSQALANRRAQAVPRGVSQLTPIFVSRSEGAVIEDLDGNRFLDFAGGIGCLNAGHREPGVVAALHAQVDRFLHTCFMVTPYESYVRLAEKLNALAPGPTPKKTMLLNSGAEAVENAIKIARAYTRRPAVICFEDAFHGRTLLTLSLTSKTHPYKAGFEPFPSDIYRVPYGQPAALLEDTFQRVVAAESVAAIIVEPVQGEGGFIVPPPGWLTAVADVCREHGILFIADEVQSGFARTGKMFAIEHEGIEPDLMVTAKSLGGGLPLAAVTGKAGIMDHTGPGALGGTFGGNPLCCEAALAAIQAIEDGELCARAMCLGEQFRGRVLAWQDRFPIIRDVRGLGAMQAFELADAASTKALTKYCYEHGLILVTAGTYGNVVRILMPLVVTDEQMAEALDVMQSALEAV
ncbi:MAG: 4-aminobutyrate--2-oxoglutarate transaminase [Bryobacteraceae bacterium]|jgi:4-aminobutyrate aminotransferase/(S)-3-amino-2-methylpropionate transaminase